MSERTQFERALGVWDASALVVGCIIGAGIFRLPSLVASELDSGLWILFAWASGGLLSLCGALTYAELSAAFPKAGGDYRFIREAYGDFAGFLFGWTKLFIERTGTVAILAFVFAEHLERALGMPSVLIKPAAFLAILALTLANIHGIRLGKNIQNIFTALKVLALSGVILAGLFAGGGSWENISAASPQPAHSLISSVGVALIFVLWTYGGWTEAAYVTEEMRNPQKDIPRAILLGVLATTALYLLVNAVYLAYIPPSEMKNSPLVAASLMDKIFQGSGGRIVAVVILISVLGALNGYILTGGRILYALALDHPLFARLSKIHPRHRTPALALTVTSSLAALLVLTRTLDAIVEYTTIAISIFFAMAGMSLFILRRKMPDVPRPFKVPAYPATPLLFIGMTFLFIGNAILREPRESLIGFGIIALGIPIYFISKSLSQ